MAVTITYDVDEPGRGAGGAPMFGMGAPMKVVTGTLTFDSSYPTGGEDISAIFDFFNDIAGTSRLHELFIESPIASAGTGKHVRVDYTNKKAMLYTNAATPAEVANASDQSGAASLRFLAVGKR